jgi:phosphoribosylglycinamide formyltransferase 1
MTVPIAVLVSGSGSNLQALLDAQRAGAPFHVAHVVSNVAGAFALERAAVAGVPTTVVPHQGRERADFERELVSVLAPVAPAFVVLAGFMRVLTSTFVGAYENRIINVHPSLLPSFPGAHAARDALAHGVRVSGCTVHLVDIGVDTGRILGQRAVDVKDTDDESALQKRIQSAEHVLLPQVISDLCRRGT